MEIILTEVQKFYNSFKNNSYDSYKSNTNAHMYFELIFNGDIKKFEIAFNKVIEIQPMLRAKVIDSNKFKIIDKFNYYIKTYNCTEKNFNTKRLKIRKKLSQKKYTSDAFPFYTLEAITKKNNKYIIMFSIDLLIADWLSIQQLFIQTKKYYMNANYTAVNESENILLINQNYFKQRKYSIKYNEDKLYWSEKIKRLYSPPLIHLSDLNIKDNKINRKSCIFDEDKTARLEIICKELGVTINTILLLFYSITLQLWAENKKFTINFTAFKRKKENMRTIGNFISIMPINFEIDDDNPLIETAKIIYENVLNIFGHSTFEITEILNEIIRQEKDFNTLPYAFTSLLFNFDKFNDFDKFDDFVKIDYWISQFPQTYIDCQVIKINNKINICWFYIDKLFEDKHIDYMFNMFIMYLENYLIDPEHVLLNIKLKQSEYIMNVYKLYNSRKSIIEKPTKKILESFQLICEKYKYNTAFFDDKNNITFDDINKQSDNIMDKITYYKTINNLIKIRIGIYGEKSVKRAIEMLAIIKSGDSFCFIPNNIPDARKEQLEKMCMLNLYLKNGQIIEISNIETKIPSDELYLVFTSGSTGMPKAISINENGVLNTIDDIVQRLGIKNNDRILNVSEFSFDLSIFDLVTPLLTGCASILCKSLYEFEYYEKYINQITLWNSTPGLMQAFIHKIKVPMKSLKYVLLSGDFISKALVDNIKERFKNENPLIYSLGGATEASIWSIFYCLNNIYNAKIPYGYPLSNQTLYILDNDDNLLPPFAEGEIVIGGDSLANGYLNDEANKRVFYKHYLLGNIYRTGDKGYFHDNGYISIVGRINSELKLNGYRIDLIEIENAVNSIKSVKSNKALIKRNVNQVDQLILFYSTYTNKYIEIQFLRQSLKNVLPHYMIPSEYIYLQDIPLTDNGKIDCKKLLKEVYLNKKTEALTQDEYKVLKIWKSILKIELNEKITNSSQSFFDAGGDSISLIELLFNLNKIYHKDITIDELLNNLTLKEQALFIKQYENNNIDFILKKNLVHLKKGKTDKNILLIHAASGEIADYNRLSNYINPDYNVFAIKLDISNNLYLRDMDFVKMAYNYNQYLDIFNNIDYLGGWCIGGVIGFEISKINNKVRNVLLIDSTYELENKEEPYKLDLSSELEFVNKFLPISYDKIEDTEDLWNKICYQLEENPQLYKNILEISSEKWSKAIPFFGQSPPKNFIYYLNLIRSFERTQTLYQASDKINKPIIFIGASDEPPYNYKSWAYHTNNEFRERFVKGNHFSIFDEPNIFELAITINQELSKT